MFHEGTATGNTSSVSGMKTLGEDSEATSGSHGEDNTERSDFSPSTLGAKRQAQEAEQRKSKYKATVEKKEAMMATVQEFKACVGNFLDLKAQQEMAQHKAAEDEKETLELKARCTDIVAGSVLAAKDKVQILDMAFKSKEMMQEMTVLSTQSTLFEAWLSYKLEQLKASEAVSVCGTNDSEA